MPYTLPPICIYPPKTDDDDRETVRKSTLASVELLHCAYGRLFCSVCRRRLVAAAQFSFLIRTALHNTDYGGGQFLLCSLGQIFYFLFFLHLLLRTLARIKLSVGLRYLTKMSNNINIQMMIILYVLYPIQLHSSVVHWVIHRSSFLLSLTEVAVAEQKHFFYILRGCCKHGMFNQITATHRMKRHRPRSMIMIRRSWAPKTSSVVAAIAIVSK